MYDFKAAGRRLKAFVRDEQTVWLRDWDNGEIIAVVRTRCQRLWRDRAQASEAETLAARGQMDMRRKVWPGTGPDDN